MTTPAQPFNFDLIDSAGYGYHRVWEERHYLLRLALVPFIIKLATTMAIYVLGIEANLLRRGLIMLPAVFAEGWMLAQFLRTLLMGERWPMALPDPGDHARMALLVERARGIISSTIVFVLISIAATMAASLIFTIEPGMEARQSQAAQQGDGGFIFFLIACVLMGAMLWGFRLLWVYIPYAVLMPVTTYLERIKGFKHSFKLLGLFLVCIVPCNVVIAIIVHVLMGAYADDAVPALNKFIAIFCSIIFDFISVLVTTAGMAYAMRGILPRHPLALADIK